MNISTAGSSKRRSCISRIIDADGNELTNKSEIAETFALFYEQLYASRQPHSHGSNGAAANSSRIPYFCDAELNDAMMKMKGGKAKDDAGIVAEMIKHGGEQLRSVILAVFNDFLADNALIPQSWK